jgi:hypothetical protein
MTEDNGMTYHALPYDVPRCHDELCQQHYVCKRWVDRRNCADWTGHLTTMRHPLADECSGFIDVEVAGL